MKTKFIPVAVLGLASLKSWADTISYDFQSDNIGGETLILPEMESGSTPVIMPIPEPSSIILMGLIALAAMLVLRNRKS